MRDAMPDAPVFLGLAADVIAKARDGGRYPKVRWWGEMVNVLWERGDVAASMDLEDQFDHLGARTRDRHFLFVRDGQFQWRSALAHAAAARHKTTPT